jgi:uncharacterized iron-regulated membrane protein
MKIFFRRIHLYLSLAAGLVILSCCLTGAILVFQKELEQAFNKDRYFVKAEGQKLSLDSLVQSVQQAHPKMKVGGVKVYDDPERSVEVSVMAPEKKKEGGKAEHKPAENSNKQQAKPGAPRGEQRTPMLTAFVNPYDGQVLELYNPREGFFYSTLALHRWLLGSNNGIGKYITGVATFMFLFILITGIILWWPKTKKILKQRLKIKSDGGWKRLNHDLHIVLGFYSFIFLFIFAFTALAWSFEWFNKGIYKVTASSMKPVEPPKSVYQDNAKKINFNTAYEAARASFANVEFFNIGMPKDSVGAITVTMLSKNAVHETASDALYIDQYTGKVLGQYLFSDRNLGARVRATFRPVHVGSIGGTTSKIISVLVCLMGASFPITGVIMWINRTRKKKRNIQRPVSETVA